jgi:hypothetical protein
MMDDNIFENQHQAPPNNQDPPEQLRARTLGEYSKPRYLGLEEMGSLEQVGPCSRNLFDVELGRDGELGTGGAVL